MCCYNIVLFCVAVRYVFCHFIYIYIYIYIYISPTIHPTNQIQYRPSRRLLPDQKNFDKSLRNEVWRSLATHQTKTPRPSPVPSGATTTTPHTHVLSTHTHTHHLHHTELNDYVNQDSNPEDDSDTSHTIAPEFELGYNNDYHTKFFHIPYTLTTDTSTAQHNPSVRYKSALTPSVAQNFN